MTEKRFTMADGEYNAPICYDNGKGLSYIDVVECLNALHEENQSYKQGVLDLIDKKFEDWGKRQGLHLREFAYIKGAFEEFKKELEHLE